MNFIGIDLSLSDTGVCVYEFAENTHHVFSIKTKSNLFDSSRIDDCVSELLEIFMQHLSRDSIVAIEDQLYSAHTQGKSTARAELAGVVKKLIRDEFSCGYYLVPPTSLKKFTCGTSYHIDKVKMKEHVELKYGYTHKNNNIIDAVALAHFGVAIFNKEIVGNFTRNNSRNQLQTP